MFESVFVQICPMRASQFKIGKLSRWIWKKLSPYILGSGYFVAGYFVAGHFVAVRFVALILPWVISSRVICSLSYFVTGLFRRGAIFVSRRSSILH
jgi:hypothetical protein